MLAAKIFVTFSIVFAFGDNACTQKEATVDDATALLQTNVEVKPGHAKDADTDVKQHGGHPEHPEEHEHGAETHEHHHQHVSHHTEHHGGKKIETKVVHNVVTKTTKPHLPTKDQHFFNKKPAVGMLAKQPSYLSRFLASFIGMTLYVFIGCGTAMSLKDSGAKMFHVSLVFGLAMAALTYALWQYMVPLNFAAVVAFLIYGMLPITDAVVMLAGQLLGSVCGSMLTMIVIPEENDNTRIPATGAGGLAGNAVSSGFTSFQALMAEAICSFILVYVTFEVAVNLSTVGSRTLWCLNLGIAYFLVHSLMIPVDGCGINPARTFGPHIVKKKYRPGDNDTTESKEQWIFWLGPIAGAVVATVVYSFMHQS